MRKIIRITTIPSSMKTLLKGQLKFMSNHFEMIAISSDDECFDEMLNEQGDIRGYRVEMTRRISPIKDLKALWKLIRIFRNEKPFIVHTHTPKAGLLGMLAAKIARVPNRMHTIAGLPLLEASGVKRNILNIVERLTNYCATNVYPNSFVMKEIMTRQGLAKADKMKVLAKGSSNGIDTSFFSADMVAKSREEIRKELGIKQNELAFIFIGRIVRDKGINELVQAISRLPKDVKLIVVGGFEKELDPIAVESEEFILKDERIKYVGFQKDVRGFLLAADVLSFPSYREGFPNVVMQAGAMGLPSIVSNINGCNEIVVDGENGLIVPPKNSNALYEAMLQLYKDGEMRHKLASNARRMIVERYEQQLIWDAILNEYKACK